MNKNISKVIRGHLIFISIYSIYILLLDYFYLKSNFRLALELNVLVQEIWIVYTLYFVLYFSFLKKPLRISTPILIFLVSIFINYLLNWYYTIQHKQYDNSVYTREYIIYQVINMYSHFFLYSLGYFFYVKYRTAWKENFAIKENLFLAEKKQIQNDNEILRLRNQITALEVQLKETEINFLRAQISPHFLFNFLNFFYGGLIKTQPVMAEGILLLSDVMRYAVKSFSAEGGMANLEEELQQTEKIIAMQQLRFTNRLNISLSTKGNLKEVKMAPMVLLTLIENMFKHGNLVKENSPATISCMAEDNKIIFKTGNKIKARINYKSENLGLRNVRERMNYYYGSSYSFEAYAKEEWFYTVMIFPFIPIPLNISNNLLLKKLTA